MDKTIEGRVTEKEIKKERKREREREREGEICADEGNERREKDRWEKTRSPLWAFKLETSVTRFGEI